MTQDGWMIFWTATFVVIFGAYLVIALVVAIRGTPQVIQMLQSAKDAKPGQPDQDIPRG